MKTAIATLESVSPYSQSKHYEVPKLDDNEPHSEFEKRTWKNRCHVSEDGHIVIPPMAFKNSLSEAAKFMSESVKGKGKATYTKHFEAGVLVLEPLVLDLTLENVQGEWLFVPSDGKRGGGKRVNKCFPIIHHWKGDVSYTVLDSTITEEVFARHLEASGKFIGVGRFRPRNNGFYGRFKVLKIKWSDA
jgi:hypothetical protein